MNLLAKVTEGLQGLIQENDTTVTWTRPDGVMFRFKWEEDASVTVQRQRHASQPLGVCSVYLTALGELGFFAERPVGSLEDLHRLIHQP